MTNTLTEQIKINGSQGNSRTALSSMSLLLAPSVGSSPACPLRGFSCWQHCSHHHRLHFQGSMENSQCRVQRSFSQPSHLDQTFSSDPFLASEASVAILYTPGPMIPRARIDQSHGKYEGKLSQGNLSHPILG